jgi:hypothetical protein
VFFEFQQNNKLELVRIILHKNTCAKPITYNHSICHLQLEKATFVVD